MTFSQFSLPAQTVNGYLWSVMKQIEPDLGNQYGKIVPFFPISDAKSGTKSWENKPYVIYDRVLRMKSGPFYPIKKEHIQYYVKGDVKDSIEWGMAIQHILDRMDAAAQDINEWNSKQEDPSEIFFHNLRVYQTESSNTRNFSVRPFYITQFIVDTEYHFSGPSVQFL